MIPLYTVADTRAIEQRMFADIPSFTLMQRAGRAVALAAMELCEKGSVLAVAGSGNNGGDAMIAAAHLQQQGYQVQVLLCAQAEQLPADAKQALLQWQERGNQCLTRAAICAANDDISALPAADLIIDGIFGIGLSRPPQGFWKKLIIAINHHAAPVLAIDTPSGLSSDSGAVLETAIKARKTVTFFGGKPGLYTGDGIDYSGQVEINSLEAPAHPASGRLMTALPAPPFLKRSKNSHKGSYGTLLLIGGEHGMLGALVLAARAAASIGAGKTIACSIAAAPAVDWQRPDIIWSNIDAVDFAAADCIAAGMGMGQSDAAASHLTRLLQQPLPLLLDADALNLLAKNTTDGQRLLQARSHATVLTPHPAEAARLLNCERADINQNRIRAAEMLSKQYACTVVLKGAGTIIHHPQEPFTICAAGNPGLARGGSGDILSGIIAGLLAQSQRAELAAATGVWLHAAAADLLAKQYGEIALDINQLAATAARLLTPGDE